MNYRPAVLLVIAFAIAFVFKHTNNYLASTPKLEIEHFILTLSSRSLLFFLVSFISLIFGTLWFFYGNLEKSQYFPLIIKMRNYTLAQILSFATVNESSGFNLLICALILSSQHIIFFFLQQKEIILKENRKKLSLMLTSILALFFFVANLFALHVFSEKFYARREVS